jgi:hypothetical protein
MTMTTPHTATTAHTNHCLDCNVPTTNKVFCPRCLDADSSLQSRCPCGAVITGPGAYCTSRCVRAYAPKIDCVLPPDDEATLAFLAQVANGDYETEDAEGDDDTSSTLQPKPVFVELRHVTHDLTEMCVSCNSKAVGKCRCGRRVCGGCVDGETGLCAYCDE